MSIQKYLYHASPVCGLKKITPQNKTAPIGFGVKSVIFATDNFAFSTMFLVNHDDSWANGGAIGDVLYFVISDEPRFRQLDKGGSVYMVSSKYFNNYNKREWFATRTLKTLSTIRFSSGLDAMIINGVQAYFTDKDTYMKIQNSPDHGMDIFNDMRSENEKRGYKVKKFDIYKGSKTKVV